MKTNRYRIALGVTGVIFSVLFIGMLAYTTWNAWTGRRSMMANSYNRRQNLYAKNIVRGNIYASDGTVLAYTERNEAGEQARVYPYGEAFAHAVGYQAKDKSGIEAYANYDLLRTSLTITEKMRHAAEEEMFPGNHVITTLDARLQQDVYHMLGDYRGAVIVSAPKTGNILAMVSNPSFDPAQVEARWDEYTLGGEDGALVNRVTQGLYPAGSTFKIMTTLAYLRSRPSDWQNYSYNCYGSFSSAGETIHCYDSVAHGIIDLKTSFALSCNSSFVNLGLAADRNVFEKTLSGMYFNSALPYDMVYNRSVTTDPRKAEVSDVMQLSIGQGDMLMTPLHMNMITCAIANGGTLRELHMLDCVADADMNVVERYDPLTVNGMLSAREAQTLTEMMRAVVTDGTGIVLADRPYNAVGKTGSAEHTEDRETDSTHAWFTGFAPAEDPEVAVTLILENAGSSGSYAVPLARLILDSYFGY